MPSQRKGQHNAPAVPHTSPPKANRSISSRPVPDPTKTLAQLQSAMAAHHAREAAELHAAQVAAMVSDIVNWRPIPSDRCDPRVWGAAAARVRAQHWAEREEKGLRFLLERIEEWKGLMAREGLMWMTSAEGDGKVWEVGEERAKRVKMSIGFLLAPFD